jgi:hypothetical protein
MLSLRLSRVIAVASRLTWFCQVRYLTQGNATISVFDDVWMLQHFDVGHKGYTDNPFAS